MTELYIGLSAWIIQDGNYSDFAVGDETRFALEFHAPDRPEKIPPATPQLIHTGDAEYQAVGRVVHVDKEEWWVVDFGVLAYGEGDPAEALAVGDWVRGNVLLGIDHFDYFERLAERPGAPALSYNWRIEDILIETAPVVEFAPRHFHRDPNKRARRAIARTDAWHDDEGYGDYVLRCSLLPGGPYRGGH